jgi:hypothetical protein
MKDLGTGYYLHLVVLADGDLEIRRTARAQVRARRFLALPVQDALFELFRDFLVKGWGFKGPEGTATYPYPPMICNEVRYTDGGEILSIGETWWFPEYRDRNPVAILFSRGKVIFSRVRAPDFSHAA